LNSRNGVCVPKGGVARNDRREDDNVECISHKLLSRDVQKKSDASVQRVVPPITMSVTAQATIKIIKVIKISKGSFFDKGITVK
jgi:hypothetical protein